MQILPPEQVSTLKTVLGSASTQVGSALAIPISSVDKFIARVNAFIRENHARIGKRPFSFVLDPEQTGSASPDISFVARETRKGNTAFGVDLQFRITRTASEDMSLSGCCRRSCSAGSFEILVISGFTYLILGGRIIDEGDPKEPDRSFVPAPSRYDRPISEFDAILNDHMEERVLHEVGFRYWYDRKKRVLLTGPDGTERLFHHDLFWWLKKHVWDALSVYAEPKGLGQDKTDINVVTPDGVYTIEVKWLGKNEKGTEFKCDRIDQGLVQVAEYLDKNKDWLWGYLVIYDARPAEQSTTYSDKLRHQLCDPPKILFLISETPSESASRYNGR